MRKAIIDPYYTLSDEELKHWAQFVDPRAKLRISLTNHDNWFYSLHCGAKPKHVVRGVGIAAFERDDAHIVTGMANRLILAGCKCSMGEIVLGEWLEAAVEDASYRLGGDPVCADFIGHAQLFQSLRNDWASIDKRT